MYNPYIGIHIQLAKYTGGFSILDIGVLEAYIFFFMYKDACLAHIWH